MHGIVYKIENKVNGKVYIGQTITTLKNRWRQHIQSASGCFALSAAFKKYGQDNFSIEEIAVAHDQEDLDLKEIEAIRQYNSVYPNGYNLRHGGLGGECSDALKKKLKKAWSNLGLLEKQRIHGLSVNNNPEFKQKRIDGLKKHWQEMDDITRIQIGKNISEGTSGVKKDMSWYTPEKAEQRKKILKEASNRPEVRAKRKTQALKNWSTPDFVVAQAEGMEKVKAQLSESAKKRFQNPEFFSQICYSTPNEHFWRE